MPTIICGIVIIGVDSHGTIFILPMVTTMSNEQRSRNVRCGNERCGLYNCVQVHGPQGPECKAHACTNPMEYFAELSVAFLGGLDDTLEHNKWFPFNIISQLREHDPRAFDLLCRMWGVVVVVVVVDEDDDDAETLIDSERVRNRKRLNHFFNISEESNTVLKA
jgi:hypothetical protein